MAGLMKRLFRGADTPAEEKAEARAVRSGKITPKQYVAGEKSEGEKEPGMMARAKALKSGKMSPAAYAKHESKEKAMKFGGKVKKMAFGGPAGMPARPPAGAAARPPAGAPARPPAGAAARPPVAAPRPMPGRPAPGRPMAKGGGVEVKGKTAGKTVKMAKGGKVDGIATKGKTRGKVC